MKKEYTKSDIELMKGRIFLAKAYATLGYVMAVGGTVGAIFSNIPSAYIVLAVFSTAAAVANGKSASKLESEVQAAEGIEAKV